MYSQWFLRNNQYTSMKNFDLTVRRSIYAYLYIYLHFWTQSFLFYIFQYFGPTQEFYGQFYSTWKHQKSFGFLMFSGGIKIPIKQVFVLATEKCELIKINIILENFPIRFRIHTKETRNRRNTICNIFLQNTALRSLLCVPNLVFLCPFKWVSLIFFRGFNQIWISKLKGWIKVQFDYFLGLIISEIFQIWTKYARLERISIMFPYLKHLQAIDPSFITITKPLSNKIIQTFDEGLEWIWKFFEINGQKNFKNVPFSWNSLNILL